MLVGGKLAMMQPIALETSQSWLRLCSWQAKPSSSGTANPIHMVCTSQGKQVKITTLPSGAASLPRGSRLIEKQVQFFISVTNILKTVKLKSESY